MVPVHSTTPVLLVKVEVEREVEILQEACAGIHSAGPGRNLLTLDVGVCHKEVVMREVAVSIMSFAKRRVGVVVDVENLVTVGVKSEFAIFIYLVNRIDRQPTLYLVH